MDKTIGIHNVLIYRNVIIIFVKPELKQYIRGCLQFGRYNIPSLRNIYSKGYQRRGNVNIVKGSRHTVLSADGRQSVSDLCIIGSQQRRKRLAPSLRICGHSPEILLEGQTDPGKISACGNDLRHGFRYGIYSAMIRAPGG